MAACVGDGREAPLRLRLLFDYPPPGTPSCGVCWLLLEPSQARLITDLISLIREKFGFSRHAKLSLFLEGALLPPTESARLVRDNDALRVKLEEVIGEGSYNKITNGFSNVSKKQKRRHRQKSETNDSESDYEEHRKRKRSKLHSKHSSSQEENAADIWDSASLMKKKKTVTGLDCVTDGRSDDNTHSKKHKKGDQRERETHKKKKKTRTHEEKNILQKTKNTLPLSSRQKNTAKNTVARSGIKNGKSSSETSTSSSTSDDSIADTKRKQMLTTKVASQHIKKSQLASPVTSVAPSKITAKPKDRHSLERAKSKKAKSQSSTSGSDSTSGEEESQQSGNLKNKPSYNNRGTGTNVTSKTKAKTSSESESSESETCVTKKPKMNAIVNQSLGGTGSQQEIPATCRLNTGSINNIRGRGRGEVPFWRGPRVRGCRGMFRGRGRGRGEITNSFYNYTSEHQKEQQLNEAAANTSVIIQNPVEIQKKDYSILPLLAAPPQVGEKIAFKLLELTENYTPEVSDYKEGKIVSWNPANKQLELEILSFSSVAKEPGKFDLVYQSADGAETVEYAVSQDRKITESWDALIEPRLIVDPPNNESSTKNGNPSNVNKQVPCINSL